ncbi:hypothetical protein ACFL6C_07945 [Myxococcota bacterium]
MWACDDIVWRAVLGYPIHMNDPETQLFEILQQRNEDGRYRFSDREVQDALGLLLLAQRPRGSESWPDGLKRGILAFVDRLGLGVNPSGEETYAAIEAYFKKNPISPELQTSLRAVATNVKNANLVSVDRLRSLSAILGTPTAPSSLNETAADGDQKISSGPFARFLLAQSKK